MRGMSRMWEERSSWNERSASLLNGCRNSTSDKSQKHKAETWAVRLENHPSESGSSVLTVASVVFMILIIKMIADFHPIEDDTQDVFLPEQLNGLLDCLAGGLSGSHY